MYVRNSIKYAKEIKIIHPGELYASNEDELIGTLLGSCIAVCLIDIEHGVSGMNHFMLPGRISDRDIFADRSARYGITAMNQLLLEVEKLGARHSSLIAKVFGGGHVMDINSNGIPMDNIRLARVYLEIEDIHIESINVGDNYTRKVLLDVKTGKVFLKKTTRDDVYLAVKEQEDEFAKGRFKNDN